MTKNEAWAKRQKAIRELDRTTHPASVEYREALEEIHEQWLRDLPPASRRAFLRGSLTGHPSRPKAIYGSHFESTRRRH